MFNTLYRSLYSGCIIALLLVPYCLSAQPMLPEECGMNTLQVFRENPHLQQIEKYLVHGDTSWLISVSSIDRQEQMVVTEAYKAVNEAEATTSKRIVISREYWRYNEHWQYVNKQLFKPSGDLVIVEEFEYNPDQLLLKQHSKTFAKGDEGEQELFSEYVTTYTYDGKNPGYTEWERKGRRLGFGETIDRAIIRYNKDGRRKLIKVMSKSLGRNQQIPARIYRWKYADNQVVQRLKNPISGSRKKLVSWYDDNGQLQREEGSMLGLDGLRTYHYTNDLLTEIRVELTHPYGSSVKHSSYRFLYK